MFSLWSLFFENIVEDSFRSSNDFIFALGHILDVVTQ